MTYEESIKYIDSIQFFGKKKGLDNMIYLMNQLENPQERLKIIHVAGTNGKGSVCAMLSSILQAQGYKVGFFTSPHLECYNERIQVNRRPISNKDFAAIATEIRLQCEEMVQSGQNHPSFFEYITAMAFTYFAQQEVDFVILEVGLGGRLDATNIIKEPLVSVITSIALDHTHILGSTLSEVTWEKAGIMKENRPTVLSCTQEEVYNIVKEIAKERKIPFYFAKTEDLSIYEQTLEGVRFSINNTYIKYEDLFLSLLGTYQIRNVCTVLLTIAVLRQQQVLISEEAIRAGLAHTEWAGRMEIISKKPLFILDGAHNPEGIKAFLETVLEQAEDRKIYIIFGVLKDKAYEQMLGQLIPHIHGIIFTEPDHPHAVATEKLAALVEGREIAIYQEKDIGKALELAKNVVQVEDILCGIGSLYLIGGIKTTQRVRKNE
ncbi:MAG: bifunctional folylpolyglutamate synthase/dihydrofolate synthase [Epulopiscium sp.]|nr:bifunctional folylpolyglutamate synthase/dihydrofolate synthase [Candidatus Epulonipiscium sp.]